MRKRNKQRLIYLRYLLPPVGLLLSLAAMLIPSYKFVAGGEVNAAISALGLIDNSFDQARQTLFGAEEATATALLFSRVVLIYVLVAALLFAVALAASVYSAVVAVRYFCDDDEVGAERQRTLFITFFPNRVVLSVVQALAIALAAFPYIMRPLYRTVYSMNVTLILTAPDGLIVCGAVLLAVFVLSVICAPMERAFGADVFEKRISDVSDDGEESEESEEYTSQFSTSTETDARESSEQNRLIRELLSKKEDNFTEGSKND